MLVKPSAGTTTRDDLPHLQTQLHQLAAIRQSPEDDRGHRAHTGSSHHSLPELQQQPHASAETQRHQTRIRIRMTEDEQLLTETVEKMLGTLNDRESKVLRGRFFEDISLQDLAKRHGVSRERIRQIEARAIRRLRHKFLIKYVLWTGKWPYEKSVAIEHQGEIQIVRKILYDTYNR